uniref:Leader peptide 1 n=1 Tax=Mammaliicoccus lentus TaxID=42858 RepID=I7JPW6_MAMLE|nr:leader peptide 1 [Mammaliicoccus lentus]ALK01334.1 leader peptide 1 [Mammaliicoccus lentus]CCG55256.1 leader peptide 1 of Erm(43) [Mammaliicoccus lentus]CCG55262.1 leader peptide 1 of Erm(43) [Mammaliicoccus lentus]
MCTSIAVVDKFLFIRNK